MFRELILLCLFVFYKNSESLPVIDDETHSEDISLDENSERDLTLLFEAGRHSLDLKFDDPAIIKKFSYENDFGPVKINAFAKNVKVHGVSKYKELHLSWDKKNQLIRFEIHIPFAHLETDNYKIGGNVMFFPIKGAGSASVEAFGIFMEGHSKFEKVMNKDGEKVIQLRSPVIENIDIKDVSVRMRGMFPGNPLLGALTHFLANQYWKEFMEIGKPEIFQHAADFVADLLLNPILIKLPFFTNYID